jgi:hypothetical protein
VEGLVFARVHQFEQTDVTSLSKMSSTTINISLQKMPIAVRRLMMAFFIAIICSPPAKCGAALLRVVYAEVPITSSVTDDAESCI